jgi:hypothetical protein
VAPVEGCLQSVRLRAAIDGMAIVQRAQRRYQALRLTAHRCAAAGLDSGTAPAVLASMPSTPQWIA